MLMVGGVCCWWGRVVGEGRRLLLTRGEEKKDVYCKKKKDVYCKKRCIFADYEICESNRNITPNDNVANELRGVWEIGEGHRFRCEISGSGRILRRKELLACYPAV